jgi:hypothetical protein
MEKTSDVYEKLYHYTTWDGLLGILQTKTLWATHYKFLNDYSEIVLFRDKLVSWILPHVREGFEELVRQSPDIEQKISQKGGLDQAIQHDSEVVVDILYRVTGDEIYILLLEMEFKGFEYSKMLLADLIYSNDEDRLKEELSEDLSIIADVVKQLFDHTKVNENEKPDTSKAFSPFVNCISRYKHYGFSEENEVRVVVLPTVIDQEFLELASKNGVTLKPEKERFFRKKNDQLIPYIELFNSIDIELPIERIIVGPHKEKEARATTLRSMLKNTKIEITCSDIPFVG